MTDFSGIERRVKEECRKVGVQKSRELATGIGKLLGYNMASTWGAPEEFEAAIKPLREYATKRFTELEFNRVWSEAEKAALDVLKNGGAA